MLELLGTPVGKQIKSAGKVKFFGEKKGFGFATSEEGDVFIHEARGRSFICDGGDQPALGHLVVPPTKDDDIMFIANEGPKGLRADIWAVMDLPLYEKVMEEINHRPLYRVQIRNGFESKSKLHYDGADKLKVEWEGRDLKSLRNEYPSNMFKQHVRERSAFIIEIFTNDHWEMCTDDPR